jgi:Transglutaminase-like superfamily/Coenzyme PQQ synthesis protein D (PqqD)
MPLYISDQVRVAIFDDVLILLDLHTAQYFLLDEVAKVMWGLATTGAQREQAIDALTVQFDAPADRIADDFDSFIKQCLTAGFLRPQPPVRREPNPNPIRSARKGLRVRAWYWLATTAIGLAVLGFTRVYRRCEELAVRPLDTRCAPPEEFVERAEKAFLAAENLVVFRRAPEDCLPRSLALFGFLRSLGLPAAHIIGVRRFPVMMHAWVQIGNLHVLERDVSRDDFRSVAVLGK